METINKNDKELISALNEHLLLLNDFICKIEEGKNYYLRVIFSTLRVLIADKNAKTNGILFYLSQRYNFNKKIKIGNQNLNLKEFLDCPIHHENNVSFKRGDCLKTIAESDGGSHESLSWTTVQYSLVFFYKNTTDGRKHLIDQCKILYEFGKEFLEYINNLK
jgi:hypothetical protein